MTERITTTVTPLDVPTLADLRRRTSVKWRQYAPDVLPLFVAEMDVAPCPAVVDAVAEALACGDLGYDFGNGYADAFADFAARRWGWSFDPEQARLVPDTMSGVTAAITTLTDVGDAVVINPPVYPPFTSFPTNAARRVVHAPLGTNGRLDFAALEEAFADATGASRYGTGPGSGRRAVFLLCNPHNPTGVAHTEEELRRALELANQWGVRVIADEIHAPLSRATDDGGNHVPLLSVPGSESAVAVCSSSKAWNLAAIRAALVVGGPQAWGDLRRMPLETRDGISHLAVIAHVAALTKGEEWLSSVIDGIERNRKLSVELVAEHLPGVRYAVPESTYLAWLDCRDLPGRAGTDPAGFFLDKAKVALNDGSAFGPGGEGHVRLNLATNVDILTEAIERMGKALR